mmetsp:Transcript_20341/g.49959  ORF Transcript_20341/g.49959 Transcript_20341/m.49959 type:complete len:391 (-) Transcript_20341:118-1290(-)
MFANAQDFGNVLQQEAEAKSTGPPVLKPYVSLPKSKDDSKAGKNRRGSDTWPRSGHRDSAVHDIEELLTQARLEKYSEAAKEKNVTLYVLLQSDEKKLEKLLDSIDMKPGHKMRLKRSLEKAKEDGWIALPPNVPRMNGAQRSLSLLSREISFDEFSHAVKSSDVKEIHHFLEKHKNEVKTVRHFFKERFKIQTGQGLRELRDEDVDTLTYIQGLYKNPSHDTRKQPLPFSLKPENFVRHLLMVESAVRGFKEIWTITDPAPIFYGFLTRKQAFSFLTHAPEGYFLFRLSVSTPNKIAFCYKKESNVRQSLVPAFQSLSDFKKFARKHSNLMKFVAWQEVGNAKSSGSRVAGSIRLEDILVIVESVQYKNKMTKAIEQINVQYRVVKGQG